MMYQDIYNRICQNTTNEYILSSMSCHQKPSIKVLFKTNAKSHKHPDVKLLSSEGKTQFVNQRRQNSYRRAYIYIYIYINTELLDGNNGHQEETHQPTHRFRRLFLDLLSMGWRGCASAMGAIKLPSSCSSPKIMCQSIHIVPRWYLKPKFGGLAHGLHGWTRCLPTSKTWAHGGW